MLMDTFHSKVFVAFGILVICVRACSNIILLTKRGVSWGCEKSVNKEVIPVCDITHNFFIHEYNRNTKQNTLHGEVICNIYIFWLVKF